MINHIISYDEQYDVMLIFFNYYAIITYLRNYCILTALFICILIAYTILAHVTTACIFISIRNNYYTFVYFLKRQYRSYHKTMQILANK